MSAVELDVCGRTRRLLQNSTAAVQIDDWSQTPDFASEQRDPHEESDQRPRAGALAAIEAT